MVPASRRLPRNDFLNYSQRGRRYHSTHLTVVHTPTKELAKTAVVVSKKVTKSAVARNRLRRRLYATLMASSAYQGTGVYVVLTKSGAATVPRMTLRSELIDILASITKAR